MARWECPACGREFDRTRQSHTCVPGNSVDRTFASYPPEYRAAYEALLAHLRSLGPVHEDAVLVGVFLKHQRKLAEVRPKARSLQLGVVLPRPVQHARISRRVTVSPERIWHFIKLHSADDVDDQLCDWLTEAYDAAGGA